MPGKPQLDASRSDPDRPRARLLPLVVFVSGAAVLAAGTIRYLSTSPQQPTAPSVTPRPSVEPAPNAPPVSSADPAPVPADLPSLEPELRSLIESGVKAVQASPTDAKAIGRLGMMYDAHGMAEYAAACYARARQLAPDEPKWIHLWAVIAKGSALEQADAAFREVIRLRPDHAPAYEYLGLLAFDRQEWDDAAGMFLKVTQLRPTEPSGFFALAQTAVAQGRLDEALAFLDQAKKNAPRWKAVDFLRGRVLQAIGNEEEALTAYSAGADSRTLFVNDPWRAEVEEFAVSRRARLDRGRQFQQRGMMTEAFKMFETLVREYPNDADVVNTLASAYIAGRRFPDARRLLEPFVAAHPDNFAARLSLAQIDIARRDLPAALAHADAAVESEPLIARTHFQRGVVLALMDRHEQAAEAHREAARLEPAMAEAHAGAGISLTRLKRWEEAVEHLSRATQLEPGSWLFVFNLGLAYEGLDDRAKAMDCFRRAKRLNPANPAIDEALGRGE